MTDKATEFWPVLKGSYIYSCIMCGERLRKDEIGHVCPKCGRVVEWAE